MRLQKSILKLFLFTTFIIFAGNIHAAANGGYYVKKTGRCGLYALQTWAGLYLLKDAYHGRYVSRPVFRTRESRFLISVAGLTSLVNGISGLERELGVWKYMKHVVGN